MLVEFWSPRHAFARDVTTFLADLLRDSSARGVNPIEYKKMDVDPTIRFTLLRRRPYPGFSSGDSRVIVSLLNIGRHRPK